MVGFIQRVQNHKIWTVSKHAFRSPPILQVGKKCPRWAEDYVPTSPGRILHTGGSGSPEELCPSFFNQRRTGTPASWASAATGWDPAGSGSPQPWPWHSPHVVHGHVSRWDGQASHSVSETDCWGSRDPWMLLKHIAKCLPDFYILQHHFGT